MRGLRFSVRYESEPRGGGRSRGQTLAGVSTKVGGGGGSRTRVRKHVVVGLYMRVRFWVFVPGVWKRLSTARP